MTTSQLWAEGSRPEHDPVAEDMDLLTHQEAAARFFDEIEELRGVEETLTSGGESNTTGLQAVRNRVADLEAALGRIVSKREPIY